MMLPNYINESLVSDVESLISSDKDIIKLKEDGYVVEAKSVYTDVAGTPIFYRLRLKNPVTKDKWIRPAYFNGDSWVLKEPDFPDSKPLYMLKDIADNPEATIWICEGEWSADHLNVLFKNTGFASAHVATTSGSATSAGKADWTPLANRKIIIWRDNDDPGISYQNEVINILRALKCEIRLVGVEALNLPDKGDCVDWLNDFEHKHNRKAELNDLLKLSLTDCPTISNEMLVVSQTNRSDVEVIEWLATLNSLDYDRVRKEYAKQLKVQLKTLDGLVKQAREEVQDNSYFAAIKPWPEPINPAQLLDEIVSTIQRFIVLDKAQAQTAALWIAASWFLDVIDCAPIALINAPEKACGKTQLLTVMAKLAPRPIQACGISPSVLFRMIQAYQPTLFVDEVETVLKNNEDLRGLFNAGHTRDSAYVWRSVAKGDDFEPKRFCVWSMKAIAGINAINLAETVTSRSIVLQLRRKKTGEVVDRLRNAEPDLIYTLVAKLARFSEDYSDSVKDTKVQLPDELSDRDQDNWEPLLQIANVAGGHWIHTALDAALTLSGESASVQSTGNELLADIQSIFPVLLSETIRTADLIEYLIEDTEAPWATYNYGKPITPRQLSKRLAQYGIKSKTIRFDKFTTAKGYEIKQFDDVFMRYLPPSNLTPQSNEALQTNEDKPSEVTYEADVTVTDVVAVTPNPSSNMAGDAVTYKNQMEGVIVERIYTGGEM